MNEQAYELWVAIEAKCRELNPHIEITQAMLEGEYQLLLNDAASSAEHP